MSDRKGELLVREGKGEKSRTLPINPEQRRAFMALLGPGSDPEDPVFTSQARTPTAAPSRSQAAGFKSYSIDSKNGSGGMSYTRTCYATLSGPTCAGRYRLARHRAIDGTCQHRHHDDPLRHARGEGPGQGDQPPRPRRRRLTAGCMQSG